MTRFALTARRLPANTPSAAQGTDRPAFTNAWCGLGVTACLVASLVAMPLTASAAAPSDAELDVAVSHMQQAAAGDNGVIEATSESFARMSAAEPTDPLLRAYAGASLALKATTTMLPWKKMSYAEDGLAQIDKALAQLTPAHDAHLHRHVPTSLETRFVAANTFLSLPSMFNRKARGAKLLDEVMAHPLFGPSPAGFKAAVWLRAAKEAQADKRPADAKALLQEVIRSGAPQAVAAQAQLKELP